MNHDVIDGKKGVIIIVVAHTNYSVSIHNVHFHIICWSNSVEKVTAVITICHLNDFLKKLASFELSPDCWGRDGKDISECTGSHLCNIFNMHICFKGFTEVDCFCIHRVKRFIYWIKKYIENICNDICSYRAVLTH